MAPHAMKRTAALLLLLGAAACDSGPSGPPDTGDVESLVVETTGNPFVRRVIVTLGRAAPVVVAWEAPGTRRLAISADSESTVHHLLIPRLRAGRKYTVAASIPLDDKAPRELSFTTEALPAEISGIGLATIGTPSEPLALIEVAGSTGFGGLLIVEDGELAGWLPMAGSLFGMARRANGEFVLNDAALGLTSFRIDGTLMHQLPQATTVTPYRRIHHEVIPWIDDKLLFIADDTATVTDTLVTGESIWEWDPATGAVAKKWSAFDHLDWSTFRGSRSVPGNWLHGNGLSLGPRGNIIMSLRNADYVISIAPDFGSVEWSLGGPEGTLGVSAADRALGQHYVSEPTLGRLLVFDNGWERPGGAYSRVIEYQIDLASDTATKAWEYRPTPDIYAALVGSAKRLSNGNTVALFGMLAGHNGSSGPLTGVEVTAAGQQVWRINFGAKITRLYRLHLTSSLIGEVTLPDPD